MSYIRVIPRDLFNEGSLLKCYGRVYINLENIAGCTAGFAVDDVDQFDIVQDQDSGAIYIENLPLVVGGRLFRLTRPINSRRSWPLYAELVGDPDFEVVDVFDDVGDFTDAMRKLVTPRLDE